MTSEKSFVLHAIILHKPFMSSKVEALAYAREHFPKETIKGFVRDSGPSFRVRIVPKTKFVKTSYVSKKINENITLVFGKLA